MSSAQSPWKFIMTCDSRGGFADSDGINEKILGELVGEVLSKNVDFVLFPGDLASGMYTETADKFESQLRRWVEIMGPVYDAGIAVYVGRGNHEVMDNFNTYPPPEPLDPNQTHAGRWLNVFGSDLFPTQKLPDNGPAGEEYMTYSVAHKNAFITMLDQYAGIGHWLSNQVNQPWLDAQLAANTKPHVFVVGHQPAFKAKNRNGLDNYPDKRDALWAGIRRAGGRLYLCGHDHFYNHARLDDGDGDPNNDVHQFIIGTAGPLYTWTMRTYPGDTSFYTVDLQHFISRNGYVLVEVDGLDVTLTWMQRQSKNPNTTGIYEPNDVWRYTAAPKPVLLSPNGGENLSSPGTYRITYTTLEGTDTNDVLIEYSTDNGQTFEHIDISPNTGLYEWDIPPVDSNQCLIRISDADNPTVSDRSDNLFAIFQCRKQLISDLNNDCYIDFRDYIILTDDWLKCGNPFDPACSEQ